MCVSASVAAPGVQLPTALSKALFIELTDIEKKKNKKKPNICIKNIINSPIV